MKVNSFILLLIFLAFTHSQITRDMALKFMFLDKDGDLLLNSTQMQPIKIDNQTIFEGHYYYWLQYKNQVFPRTFWKKYDTDKDDKISFLQFHPIVTKKIKRHAANWPSSTKNVLSVLSTQDYFLVCDSDTNKYLTQQQFVVCIKAFTSYQFQQYPYKVKSLLYPNRTVGYTYQQFKKLLPFINKNDENAQNSLHKLFQKYEWSAQKIHADSDLMIGPQQGKFAQPSLIFFYTDTNKDQVLDKKEAERFFSTRGGDQAFTVADFTNDQKLQKAELIAYFLFAMCIDGECDERQSEKVQSCDMNSDLPAQQKSICSILKGLNKHYTNLNDNTNQKTNQETQQESPKFTYQQL